MYFTRSFNYLKQQGPLRFARHLLQQMGFCFYRRTLIFFHLALDHIPEDPPQSYTFSILSKRDVEKEANYFDGWFNRKEASKRLARGNRVFSLKRDNRIIFSLWAETQRVRIPWFQLTFDIPKDTVYTTCLYTTPELRGNGIAYGMKSEILQYFKTNAVKHNFLVIDPSNRLSIKLNEKLGFKEYQRVYYTRYWIVKYFRVTKSDSDQTRTFLSLFKSPHSIWKTFYDSSFSLSHVCMRSQRANNVTGK